MSAAGASQPFSRRGALGLVLFGALVFVALLWMVGQGLAGEGTNDGGAHVDGRGLNGYAALAELLERRGYPITRSRSEEAFTQAGLLVLTPAADANGREIDKVVARHREIGPTLVITPKWAAMPAAELGGRRGWVRLVGPDLPHWPGFLDEVVLDRQTGRGGKSVAWHAGAITGRFPDGRLVVSGAGSGLVPLVTGDDGRVYAAYLNDGDFPALAALAPPGSVSAAADGDAPYPLILVFDPDLLNNYGMATRSSARLAAALAQASVEQSDPIVFDLTLNGLGRKANLLTLAFTPPFLAATLCLLLAAAATGWRAFLRFGPPRTQGRAIAFGKRALVTNAAGLIVRSGRLHLLGRPYAEAARQRLVRAFAFPRGGDAGAELSALDRAAKAQGLSDQGGGDHAFSQASARLSQARSERELVKAAHDLHALERTLAQ